MKKTILIVALLVLALGVFGVGVAFAQAGTPPGYGSMMGGGYGAMHDYVEEALADKLGITEKNVEDALASGKTMYQIVLDNGVAEADIPALLADVYTQAFDKAVADGVIITRAQADFMLQRMTSNGFNSVNFPMQNGGYGAMYDYVEQALAAKLGITEADVESALASGKTMYQIALDNGIKEADVTALLTGVHTTAFDKAVADGVITRAQADFMLQHMTANGFNSGNYPMQNGLGGGYGRGNGYGGGMMGGGRWQQQPPTVQQ